MFINLQIWNYSKLLNLELMSVNKYLLSPCCRPRSVPNYMNPKVNDTQSFSSGRLYMAEEANVQTIDDNGLS